MKQSFWAMFAFDLRALAALRIGFGLMILGDVLLRAQNLTAHSTDAGILPRAVLKQITIDYGAPWSISLNMLSGESWWQIVLLSLLGIAAFLTIVGYKSRVALVACQILIIGFQGRNPLVLQGGDDFLRCMLFWTLFLPMGARWSADAYIARFRQREVEPTTNHVASWATVGLLLQLCMMYWCTAMMKTGEPWVKSFDAAYLALSSHHFTTSIGYWFTNFPALLRGLTLGSLAWEFFGPFLLFVPVAAWRGSCRMLTAAGFIGMHMSFNLCMDLGLFSWICSIAWLVVLPSGFWDRFSRSRSQQSTIQQTTIPQIPNGTTILVNSIVLKAFLITMIAYVILVNLIRMGRPPYEPVQLEPLHTIGKIVGLNQHWPMFSPGPPPWGSWIVMRGQLQNGREVDLWHHERLLSVTKPALVSSEYASPHWRRSFVHLIEPPTEDYRRSFLNYYISQWNQTHAQDEHVVSAELTLYGSMTPLPGDLNPAKLESISLCQTHTSQN